MEYKGRKLSETDLVKLVFISIAAIITIRNIYTYSQFAYWRHDCEYYIPSYDPKLREEGRWINYLLFSNLQRIPGSISVIISYISLGVFTYKSVENITKDKLMSSMLAFTMVSMPALAAQLIWPTTTLPGFVFLGLTPFIYRKMSKNKFFLLSGIIYFGCLSNYYFLVPLIFLGDFLEQTKDKNLKDSFLFTLKEIIAPWIICFILGYVVAELMTYLFTGQLIVMADWREVHKANSVSQLVVNIKTVFSELANYCLKIKGYLGWILTVIILICSIISLKKQTLMYALICIMIIFSQHCSTVYHGIRVDDRTLVNVYAGLIFLLLVPKYKFCKTYILNFCLSFAVFIAFSNASYTMLASYEMFTNTYYDELTEGDIELNPTYYESVILLINDEEVDHFNRKIKQRSRVQMPLGPGNNVRLAIMPPLKEMGFRDEKIVMNPEGYEFEKVYDEDNIFIKKIDENNNLVIYFNHDAYDSTWEEK